MKTVTGSRLFNAQLTESLGSGWFAQVNLRARPTDGWAGPMYAAANPEMNFRFESFSHEQSPCFKWILKKALTIMCLFQIPKCVLKTRSLRFSNSNSPFSEPENLYLEKILNSPPLSVKIIWSPSVEWEVDYCLPAVKFRSIDVQVAV